MDVIASVAQLRDHLAAVAEMDLTLIKGREFYERPEGLILISSDQADHPGAKHVFQLVSTTRDGFGIICQKNLMYAQYSCTTEVCVLKCGFSTI